MLARAIDLLAARSNRIDSVLPYVSDHSESLGEKNLYLRGMPRVLAPAEQTEVPMLAWMSQGAQRRLRVGLGALERAAAAPYSHDNISHTVLGAFGIATSAHQPRLDIWAAARDGPSDEVPPCRRRRRRRPRCAGCTLMGAGHPHAIPGAGNERSPWLALALTSAFLAVEVAAGIAFDSLALLADAAHMFTDAAALGIALAAARLTRRPADPRRAYGYRRFEILAAAFNALLLFAVAIYILVEAWQRFRAPAEVQSTGMLAVAALGLVVNLISMRLLRAGKDESLNVKGAYFEVWSDMLTRPRNAWRTSCNTPCTGIVI